MNVNTSPCPIERLIEHSAEHFISPAVESFEQLAVRRADNMDLMIQFLKRLAQRSPSPEALERVNEAIGNVTGAKFELLAAAGR